MVAIATAFRGDADICSGRPEPHLGSCSADEQAPCGGSDSNGLTSIHSQAFATPLPSLLGWMHQRASNSMSNQVGHAGQCSEHLVHSMSDSSPQGTPQKLLLQELIGYLSKPECSGDNATVEKQNIPEEATSAGSWSASDDIEISAERRHFLSAVQEAKNALQRRRTLETKHGQVCLCLTLSRNAALSGEPAHTSRQSLQTPIDNCFASQACLDWCAGTGLKRCENISPMALGTNIPGQDPLHVARANQRDSGDASAPFAPAVASQSVPASGSPKEMIATSEPSKSSTNECDGKLDEARKRRTASILRQQRKMAINHGRVIAALLTQNPFCLSCNLLLPAGETSSSDVAREAAVAEVPPTIASFPPREDPQQQVSFPIPAVSWQSLQEAFLRSAPTLPSPVELDSHFQLSPLPPSVTSATHTAASFPAMEQPQHPMPQQPSPWTFALPPPRGLTAAGPPPFASMAPLGPSLHASQMPPILLPSQIGTLPMVNSENPSDASIVVPTVGRIRLPPPPPRGPPPMLEKAQHK